MTLALPPSPRRWTALVAVLLGILTFALYVRVAGHEFTTYDDGSYVFANPHVRQGLTWDSIRWAFTRSHSSNWHPLTWMSHMLDDELFGMRAGRHHLMSAGIHALNGMLLLLALRAMRCPLWPSAFVAAMFALHPLRVESVAWASERKDVLSGMFWMLTLLAYAAYARRPGWTRYLLVTLALVLGLLSKPMLVTLPCVLLLLDVWPLRRWRPRDGEEAARGSSTPAFARASAGRLLLEKLPWLGIALASSIVTVIVQADGGAVRTFLALSLEDRIANAFLSIVAYLGKTLWPTGLAIFYPHPAIVTPASFNPLALDIITAAACVLVATVVALASTRKRPWITTGWLWTLGTLAPVIGVLQVGEQAYADRYTYLTMIGFTLVIAWSLHELVARRPGLRIPVVGVALLFLGTCSALTYVQVGHWRNTVTLFNHALDVTEKNYVAYFNLGVAFEKRAPEKARDYYLRSLAVRPNATDARYNLGVVYMRAGQNEEAEKSFRRTLQIQPDKLNAIINLGITLVRQERDEEATAIFERATKVHPRSASAHANLAKLHAKLGDHARAQELYLTALRLNPQAITARFGLGLSLFELGRPEEASDAFEAVLKAEPNHADARAWREQARRAAGMARAPRRSSAPAPGLPAGETDG